jgi:hypothetical protein
MTKRYTSDFDQWLRGYKEQHPETEWAQREGRALLWDKSPEDVERPRSVVTNRQKGYVYYELEQYSPVPLEKKK